MEKQTRSTQMETQSAASETAAEELPQEMGSIALLAAEVELTERTQERFRIFKMYHQYRGV